MKEVDLEYAKKRTIEVMITIGRNVKNRRLKMGLTQLDVAFYINADKCLISAIERGYLKNTTLMTLVKLVSLFEIDLVDLLKEEIP